MVTEATETTGGFGLDLDLLQVFDDDGLAADLADLAAGLADLAAGWLGWLGLLAGLLAGWLAGWLGWIIGLIAGEHTTTISDH